MDTCHTEDMTTNQTGRILVSVNLTVDVDADEWNLDYGADDVRRDVRTAAADAVLYVNPAVKSVRIRSGR